MTRIPQATIVAFQKKILSWYEANKRDLPWRDIPTSTSLEQRAYKVLVSEVMLQQTQVSRVIPKYEAWIRKFPTVEILAKASTSDVLRLWSGLGYNRRALNLQKAAKMIASSSSSQERGSTDSRLHENDKKGSRLTSFARTITFPRTIEELKKLPGVGEYTARAVACFAFDEQIAVVDTNVRKVILLEFLLKGSNGAKETNGTKGIKEIQEIADQLLPRGRARGWNQALMDYAALMLKDKKVPLKKQSTFKGSNRYYRGKLIRLLLAESPRAFSEVGKLLKQDFAQEDKAWFLQMLSQMKKEGFIHVSGKQVSLQSKS